jgi:hypothetical protein
MKILIIGDIHGRTCWKDMADIKYLLYADEESAGFGGFIPEYDYYIFLADYVDSFDITSEKIKKNLLEIIRFKKLYNSNVILLWGNHDIEYFLNEPWKKIKNAITGFRPDAHFDLYDIFNINRDLFQLAFQIENYLFSHAGIHQGWYNFVFFKAIKDMNMDNMTIAEQLNEAFRYRLECLFDCDWYRGGSKKVGGPLWCSKEYISKKPLKGYHQYVGHTALEDFKTFDFKNDTSVTFCDILAHKKDYYTIII